MVLESMYFLLETVTNLQKLFVAATLLLQLSAKTHQVAFKALVFGIIILQTALKFVSAVSFIVSLSEKLSLGLDLEVVALLTVLNILREATVF